MKTLLLLLFATLPAWGLGLAWTRNPEPDVCTYVARAESGNIMEPAHEVSVTDPECRFEDLAPGVEYTFTVIAINTSGMRSLPSDPVKGTMPLVPPVEPPVALPQKTIKAIAIQLSPEGGEWFTAIYLPVPWEPFQSMNVRARIEEILLPQEP